VTAPTSRNGSELQRRADGRHTCQPKGYRYEAEIEPVAAQLGVLGKMSNGKANSQSSLESQIIGSFIELRQRAQSAGPKRVAVIVADDEVALTAAEGALNLGIAQPVLIGNERNIRDKAEQLKLSALIAEAKFVAAKDPTGTAVQMARDGNVDVLRWWCWPRWHYFSRGVSNLPRAIRMSVFARERFLGPASPTMVKPSFSAGDGKEGQRRSRSRE